MIDTLLTLLANLLVAMFFAGLIGCVLMIIVSWVEIFADGFTDDDHSD
jgi:uncharacterized protein involved in exopolysaccharide biosynthesis